MATTNKRRPFRVDVAAFVDRALEANGSIIIKRRGKKDVAIIPAEKLRELDTTDYLLASEANRRRLMTALRDARAGKGRPMTVSALRKLVGLD